MPARLLFAGLAGIAALLTPATADACSCGGPGTSMTWARWADVVVIGTIRLGELPPDARGVELLFAPAYLEPERVFVGELDEPVMVSAGGGPPTTCHFNFRAGERWLIYGALEGNSLRTDKCIRTRLVEDAVADIAYLENLQQGRPQGIVHGRVYRNPGGGDPSATHSIIDSLTVVAEGGGRRFVTTLDQAPYMTSQTSYQLVLPPGSFDVCVERDEQAVSPRVGVSVDDQDEQRLLLFYD